MDGAKHTGDDLSDFYLLNCIIEAGGFTAAARQTGLTRSLLSRRIQALEARLGIQLLHRSTRRFSVTPAGEAVYRHSITMLQAAESARAAAREMQHGSTGRLRVCLPALLESLLARALVDFSLANPRIQISVHWKHEPCQLDTQDTDIALILHEPERHRGNTQTQALAALRWVVVGSPALLGQLEHPSHPQRVPNRYLLDYGSPHYRQPWLLRNEKARIHAQASLNSNSLETLREAAIAGLGLVQLPFYACRQAIAAGLLCTAFDSLEPEPVLLRALTPSGRGLTQAMQNLLDSLQTALSGREGEGILKPPSRR